MAFTSFKSSKAFKVILTVVCGAPTHHLSSRAAVWCRMLRVFDGMPFLYHPQGFLLYPQLLILPEEAACVPHRSAIAKVLFRPFDY